MTGNVSLWISFFFRTKEACWFKIYDMMETESDNEILLKRKAGILVSIYTKIKDNYASFTKSEQRVAKYCLDNYMEVSTHTLSQLAEKANCGEATVVRFCKKIRCESYHDFKEELAEETREHRKSENDSFVTQIYHNIQTSIEYTIENLDLNQLDEIAGRMEKAGIIFCAGVGNSGIPAEACAMRLVRNGKNGVYFKDSHFQSIYLNELKRGDIAIFFSASGESIDTLHCAEILKQRKVTTVCVTSSIVSSLASLCDYCILMKRWSGPLGGGSMIGQITQLYIADLLSTRTGMIDQKATLKAKETTFDYILDKMNKEKI